MNAINRQTRARVVGIGVALLVVLAVTLGAIFIYRGHYAGAQESEHEGKLTADSQTAIRVRVVKPHLDPNFEMTVERPCSVEAYYTASIEARASGIITFLKVAPGSLVKKGELLVGIDVPDRLGDEHEKASTVKQREAEVELAKEKVTGALALVKTALANIKEREAQTMYRKAQYDRLYALRGSNAVDQNVVDEAFKNWKYAEAATLKSKAELEDAEANVRIATAEVKRIQALVDVAKGDHEQAKALLNYASVKAPFDGTVVQRLVNPGSTVQDATRGNPTALLVLERKDIVTVAMQLPDNYAQFVTPGTEAIMDFDSLPGLKIHGKVTRYSDSLLSPNNDRTMRVEVDLWNRSPQEYQKFIADPKNLKELKDDMKRMPALPLVPQFTGKDRLKRSTELKSKMYGNMTLVLHNFGSAYLIPSQAVLREGGRSKVYVVRQGKAHLIAVEELVNDGNLALVERLNEHDQVTGPLDGSEDVIISNQEELTEGQPVKPTLVDDWKSLEKRKTH